MSIFYFAIFTLFLASNISALVAPADVYSAVIYNTRDSPIHCNIIWLQPSNQPLESGLFTVENNQNYLVGEKLFEIDDMEFRAVIKEIRCGHLVLRAPFNGVKSPTVNWEFFVTRTEIVSGGTSSRTLNY